MAATAWILDREAFRLGDVTGNGDDKTTIRCAQKKEKKK